MSLLDRVDPEKHRCFYIDGEFQFAINIDPQVTDPKQIVTDFSNYAGWKSYAAYCGIKIEKYKVSHDLKRVDILTVPVGKEKSKGKTPKPQLLLEKDSFEDGKWRKCILQICRGEEILYEDFLLAKDKEEYQSSKRVLSDSPKRKAFSEQHKGEGLVFKYKTEKVAPNT